MAKRGRCTDLLLSKMSVHILRPLVLLDLENKGAFLTDPQ